MPPEDEVAPSSPPPNSFQDTGTSESTLLSTNGDTAHGDSPDASTVSSSRKSRKSKPPRAQDVNVPVYGKVPHLKKEDGEPLWRRDIQYDFLRAIFDNDQPVFTNSYEPDRVGRQCFADLYIDTMARSSKTSKVLRDKLLSDRDAAKGMAMVCLLVNIGRMNTTLNFFPEMRAQLRTYHAIPSLQAHQDAHTYKQLQDAPRLKSILKGGTDDRPEPSTLNDVKSLKVPRTNPVNLLFLLCNSAQTVHELHFPPYQEFHDLIMKTHYTSHSRARAFLWLLWFYLESDFTEEGCEENPFGPGVDYGLSVANQGVPELEPMSPEQETLENVDPADELEFGAAKQRMRAKIIDSDLITTAVISPESAASSTSTSTASAAKRVPRVDSTSSRASLTGHSTPTSTTPTSLSTPLLPLAAAAAAAPAGNKTSSSSTLENGPVILPRIRPSKFPESDVDSPRATPPPPLRSSRPSAHHTSSLTITSTLQDTSLAYPTPPSKSTLFSHQQATDPSSHHHHPSGLRARRHTRLPYEISDGSHREGDAGSRKSRAQSAIQVAAEQKRHHQARSIIRQNLQRVHHKIRKSRRRDGALLRAHRRIRAYPDIVVDSDDEDSRLMVLPSSVAESHIFREKGPLGLCQLLDEGQDEYGEEYATYAGALRRIHRRLARWAQLTGDDVRVMATFRPHHRRRSASLVDYPDLDEGYADPEPGLKKPSRSRQKSSSAGPPHGDDDEAGDSVYGNDTTMAEGDTTLGETTLLDETMAEEEEDEEEEAEDTETGDAADEEDDEEEDEMELGS